MAFPSRLVLRVSRDTCISPALLLFAMISKEVNRVLPCLNFYGHFYTYYDRNILSWHFFENVFYFYKFIVENV